VITYSTYLKGLLKQKSIEKAFKVYEECIKEKEFVKLDEIFYNTLLDGMLKNNEIEKCDKIY